MRRICCAIGAGLLVLATAVGLPAQVGVRAPSPPRPASPSMPKVAESPAEPTRVELAILTLTCPSDAAGRLDLGKVSADGLTPAALLDRLQEYGEAQVTFRTSSEINLAVGTEIVHGSRVPCVQDVKVSDQGKVTPSVSYEKVGTIVKLRGYWRDDEPEAAVVVCKIETSAVVKSLVQVASGVMLPVFSELSVEQTIPVRDGRPTCFMVGGIPQSNETESITHLYLVYLSLERAEKGDEASASAAAGGPSSGT